MIPKSMYNILSIARGKVHWQQQPGHEYTKANVKFAISVLQSDPVKKLHAFAEENKETQGKFTIADEKVIISFNLKSLDLSLTIDRNIMYSCA